MDQASERIMSYVSNAIKPVDPKEVLTTRISHFAIWNLAREGKIVFNDVWQITLPISRKKKHD